MESRHKSVPPLIPPKSPTLLRNKHLSQQNLVQHPAKHGILSNNKKLDKDKTTIPAAHKKTHLIGVEKRNSMDSMDMVEIQQTTAPLHQQLSDEITMKRSYEKLNESSFHKSPFTSIFRRRKSSSDETPISITDLKSYSNTNNNNSIHHHHYHHHHQHHHPIEATNEVSPLSSPHRKNSIKSKQQQSPLVISNRGSLPLKLSKLSLGSTCGRMSTDSLDNEIIQPSDTETETAAAQSSSISEVKILVNNVEVKLRQKDGELPNPRRPLKRKSQDYDRNLLSESGNLTSAARNSDFWLPKVKVTPSMVTQLNANILAKVNTTKTSNSSNDKQDEGERTTHVIQFLHDFFKTNDFLHPGETVTYAVETMSTRIVSPTDDEYWTILTTFQMINVCFSSKRPETVKVLGNLFLNQIKRILTNPDLTLAYIVGPAIEIVTGNSKKTEKLISSILVSALRAQKSTPAFCSTKLLEDKVEKSHEHEQQQQQLPKVMSPSRTTANSSVAEFLEVFHLSNTLEIPSIHETFKKLFPTEKQVFYSSAVVVRFDQMAPDIEIPVRIQVATDGMEFRASILKLSGCSLTFSNPVRTFFSYNPGERLTNIDVSNPSKFTVKRIESPKPNSLLMSHVEDSDKCGNFIVETPNTQQAEEIFQRISTIQKNATIGNGKQVAHVFITEISLLAFKIHTYENIFQIPILNLVKLHNKPSNQQATCLLELESTEAMDFIPSESPCWSLTFNTDMQKNKFINRVSEFLQEDQK